MAIIPFSNTVDIFGTKVGLYGVDPSVGILFAFAFGAIAFYGLMLGGWASGSKYSFLGSMRSAAQLISYEVAQGLSLVGVIMMTGSLSLVDIVEWQGDHCCSSSRSSSASSSSSSPASPRPTARRSTSPEADAELVGGYNTEYGGGRFAAFFAAEYANIVVVSALDRDALPRRLEAAVGGPADLGRPVRGARQDDLVIFVLHLGPRDAAAPALRPADVAWVEDPPPARDAERPRDRDPGGDHLMAHATWNPGDDVIAVQRGPSPGGAGGAYRAFGETLRGLKTTMARWVEGPKTIQYPEEKVPVYPRFRGRHKLHRFEDTGLEKCVGCSLCAAACPADCIRVVAAENTPDNRVCAGERYAAVYEINLSRCIFCGYCEVACPFDAITMGHDYEMSDYNRSDLIFTKEMLLAEPLERTPLRAAGE